MSSTRPPDNGTDSYKNSNGMYDQSGISFCVVGVYIFCLSIMAIFMCLRARTRLRTSACVFIYIQLVVAAVGMFWALDQRIVPQWFWLSTFAAEGIGMVVLCHTIVSVGNGFYPMAGKKNVFWRMAIGMIVVYALVAIANIAFYVQQKVVYHEISPDDLRTLGATIKNDSINEWRNCRQYYSYYPDHPNGVDNWTQLSCTQMEVYGRPNLSFYIVHQMTMFLACVWTSFYLFIPLVRNHRHGPVGRPADSDTMAIGIWYLSCIVVLTLFYWGLNIVYILQGPKLAFRPIAQAVDLGLRATVSPVFFLPAPPCLIRFYRQHIKQNGHGSNSLNGAGGSKYGGANRRNGSFTAEVNGHQGSFTTMEDPHVLNSPPYSPGGSRLGRFDETGSRLGASLDSEVNPHSDREVTDKNKNQRLTSNGSAYSRMRLFQSRDRGPSMESRKMFNREFDQDDNNDDQHGPEDLSRLNSFEYQNTDRSLSPRFSGPSIMEVQEPEAALTTSGLKELERWSNHLRGDSNNASVEKMEMTDQSSQPKAKFESNPIIGTTGWEVGGWGHIRRNSEGNENSLSSPLDPYSSNPAQFAQPQVAQNPEPNNEKPIELSTVVNIHDSEQDKIAPVPDSMIQGLTGLQRQLAEHRSALLPMVLAMQERDECQASVTYDSHDENYRGRDNTDGNEPRRHRSRGALNRRYDDTIISGMPTTYSEISLSQNSEATAAGKPSTEEKSAGNGTSPIHSANSLHWSNYPANKSVISIHGTEDTYSTQSNFHSGSGSSKSAEKSAPGFRMKWLPGRKPDEGDHQAPSKKLGADSSSVTVNIAADESKSNKRNSINMSSSDGALVAKGGKPKEPRRGVFSKVLGGDRGRSSQDINDQERDTKLLDSEGKPLGNAHSSPVPATVEALALESTIGLDANDEEKGLQYYYPDPYFSLAEFKSPQSSSRDQATTQGANLNRNTSISSQRHPLSTIYSDEESINDASSNIESIAANMTMLALIRGDDSQANSSLKTPSTKANKSSKKSSKKDTAPLPSLDSSIIDNHNNSSTATITTNASTSNSAPLSAGTSPQTSLPFGSLLTRSSSGSKKSDSKTKTKAGRSRSDATPTQGSAELSMQAEATVDVMPIPVVRKSSIPNAPAIRQPAKTSLSPPPRQSWARSKSFQGSTSAIAAALLSSKQSTGNFSIDTKLANERGVYTAAVTPTSDVEPASTDVRTSFSSSVGSPTTASMSPSLSPTLEAMERDERNERTAIYTPSSPPLLPLPAVPTSTAPSSFARLENLRTRIPVDYRTHSLDRESYIYGPPGSTSTNPKTGFSTAAMDMRRANNRHQRSVDNLASSYYYKRAAEFSGNNSISQRKPTGGRSRERERENEYNSSNNPLASASQQQPSDYYGSGIGADVEGRRRDPLSQSTSGNGGHTLHRSKSSLDYSLSGVGIPGVSQAKLNDANDDTRTSSLTDIQRIMADDSWTKAMVARAQNGGSGASSSTHSSSLPPTLPSPRNMYPQDMEEFILRTYLERERVTINGSSNTSKSPKLGSSGGGTFLSLGSKSSKGKSNSSANNSNSNININTNSNNNSVSSISKSGSNTRATSPLSPEFYTRPGINRDGSE